MKLFYDETYSPHSATFDTHAKARLVAERARELPGVDIVSPRPATADELNSIHDERYVEAVLTGSPEDLASSNGFCWSPPLRDSILASTGGVRDAVLTALASGGVAGSLSSGLHHASSRKGQGFCTVNGLVLGARAALDAGSARVLIIDFDAHCGGGTASMISGVSGVEQIDVSVSRFDHYTNTDNARLWMSNGQNYLRDVNSALESVHAPDSIDLVLYNAGVDAHEHAGGVRGVTTEVIRRREYRVVEWCQSYGLPVAFVLAGGYSGGEFGMGDIADLHLLLVDAARQLTKVDS